MHLGSGSVVPSRTGFTPTGSPRPSRPGQIDPGLIEGIAGSADPSVVSEMSHASAAALARPRHHSADPQVVERVLTLVDREGVDMIAELWSRSGTLDRCRASCGGCTRCAHGCGATAI